MSALLFSWRRLEHGFRLARIRIDTEHQELGGDGAEVDRVIDERLRQLIIETQGFAAAGLTGRARSEDKVDELFDLVLDRIERHDANLADDGRDPPRNAQSVACAPFQVKGSRKARQGG